MTAALRKTEPTRHLYAGHSYTNADNTDVRVTWEKWRAEVLKAETAQSVQESAIAEHQSMNIRSFRR